MSPVSNKKILLFIYLGLLLLSIPVTFLFVGREQDPRTQAVASTTLNFSPESFNAPLQKNVGDTIPLDIMVNPGNNLVTLVRFQIKFDNAKLALADNNAFVPNITAFPNTIEGPIPGTDNIAASLSIGSDATKVIQSKTKLATITFKAIDGTGGQPTQISFTGLTQVLSSAAGDQPGENVLSGTTPANIVINSSSTSATPTASPSAATTPTPTPDTTTLSFTILLHGIGAAGDNPNPGGYELSNKNPLHPQRKLDVEIYDSTNKLTTNAPVSIIYNTEGGIFAGEADLGSAFTPGNYSLKIKTDRYLRRLIPGIQALENLKENTIPPIDLIAGDINGDNLLNILDYNIMLNCGYGQLNPLPMADPNSIFNSSACKGHAALSEFADLDDNGIINSSDYNLFLRELSVQIGD